MISISSKDEGILKRENPHVRSVMFESNIGAPELQLISFMRVGLMELIRARNRLSFRKNADVQSIYRDGLRSAIPCEISKYQSCQ